MRTRERKPTQFRPKIRRTFRALGGRRVVIEGFGKGSPALLVIAGGNDPPINAWLSEAALRQLVEGVKRILR